MDTDGASARTQQPSIRSFFQSRAPTYTAPPPTAPPLPTHSKSATTTPLPLPPRLDVIYSSPTSQQTPRKAPISDASSNLPSQATISLIQEQHVHPLRRINSLLLPIHYPDSFYHKITASSPLPSFSYAITWADPSISSEGKVIGGIVCRLEPVMSQDPNTQTPYIVPDCYTLYIQSLALLSPYRGKGLAAAVLDAVISSAADATLQPNGFRVVELYAHVWTENSEALEWYAKRGFNRDDGLLLGYYRKLKPDTAFLLRRRILPSDCLHSQSENTPAPLPTLAPSLRSQPKTQENTPLRPTIAPARSFQDRGPEREWNDLPEDVLSNPLLKPQSHLGSADASAASSRSSSRSGAGGKKKRVYPAAAFGS